jgi:hypothetical protein
LRVDLHLHSRYSPDSVSTLEAIIERCRECGLDRIALTDHNVVEGALELAALAPELAIVGEEAKTREGEVIGLFITDRIPPYMRAEEAMDLIHEMAAWCTCRIPSTETVPTTARSAWSSWRRESTSWRSTTHGPKPRPTRPPHGSRVSCTK